MTYNLKRFFYELWIALTFQKGERVVGVILWFNIAAVVFVILY